MIVAAGIVAAVLLLVLESRRRDRQHRIVRMAASLVAVAALVFWRWQMAEGEPEPERESADAVLWTAGADAVESIAGATEFALPAARKPNDKATVIPDVAYLRRRRPELDRLTILGDGVESFELETLRGLRVAYRPGTSKVETPSIEFLHAPRRVALGEAIELRGRLAGLAPGEKIRVSVEGPEGGEASSGVSVDAAEPSFAMTVPAPSAEGRFVWRIRLRRDDETAAVLAEERVGIAVTAAALPRVLVLESSPNLETSHLQRWFAESGGAFVSRTLVGENRFRFASSGAGKGQFPEVNAELLGSFDLLVVDAQTLASLRLEESEAVRAAVAKDGLGVLILPRGEQALPNEYSVWKILPAPADVEGEKRAVRLTWRGLAAPLEIPVALEPASLAPDDATHALVNDSRGDVMVSASAHGRGEIAVSLVRETWRWRLQNQSATFARYWSFLLGRLAKLGAADQWAIGNPSDAPLVVNQPIELEHTTGAETPKAAEVRAASAPAAAALPLAQDATEPARWHATYWPRVPGWHRVSSADGGAHLDFFVHDAGEWAGVRAANRRAATERFVAVSKESPRVAFDGEAGRVTVAGLWACFAAFLLSSSYLWYERRNVARSL